jgi:hypothetical protein
MFEYTFNKPNIIFLELLGPLFENINLHPYNFDYSDNILKLIYTQELTNEQYIVLNEFITSYNPPLTRPDSFHSACNIQIIKNTTNNDEWVLVGSCHYQPNIDVSIDLVNVTFITNIDTGSYQTRVYNLANNSIIGISSVLNNPIREINTIDINIKPTTECIIELHAKVSNTSSKCNIDSAQLNLYVKN